MTNKRTFKKLVSFLLAVIMMFSVMTTAFAAETDVAQTGATQTVYIGIVSHIGVNDVSVHYYNNSNLDKSVALSSSNSNGEIIKHTFQSGSYWGNTQSFSVYAVEIPAEATHYQVFRDNWNDQPNRYGSSEKITAGNAYLFWEYDGSHHSLMKAYTPSGAGSLDITPADFPFDFVEGERKVYLVDTAKWGTAYCYSWATGGNGTVAWPGSAMTLTGKITVGNNTYNVYEHVVLPNENNIIFNNGGSQTDNLTYRDYYFYVNGSNKWEGPKTPIAATEPPTEDPDNPTAKERIYVRDNQSDFDYASEDAKFFARGNDGITVEMTKTVDAISGNALWYVDTAKTNDKFTFYRTSHYHKASNASKTPWNTWNYSSTSRGTNTLFNITSGSGGAWSTTNTIKPADINTIDNFWYGFWVDTKNNLSPKTVVRSEFKDNVFTLYLPSYVDLSKLQLYSSFKEVTIKGGAYTTGLTLDSGTATTVNLTTGVTYNLNTQDDLNNTKNGTYQLKVYTTSDTAAMLMTTNKELYTGTTTANANSKAWVGDVNGDNWSNEYKDAIETKGSYYFFGEDKKQVNTDTVLKKIKGRGNSSFKASMELYGKYAYNFNLNEATELIDGASPSKKWCLLANNPDITMMRNTFIYSLADLVGLKYGPETRLVDLYDNGKYLGAYILTEKVEYGKETLMSDLQSLDKGNEKANSYEKYEFDTDHLQDGTVTTYKEYDCKYYTKFDQPAVKDDAGNELMAAKPNQDYKSPANFATEYNFLLEFELHDRYENEASWFVSPRTGQAVVVKYPEFATEDEMKYIIDRFEAAESAIYEQNSDFDAISAQVDVDSFARMYLIQELAINLDSSATSYYIHTDRSNGKLVASPVWDYDWSLGSYAKNLKYIYNDSTKQVTTSGNMSNPKQMFVKYKAIQTDDGGRADGKQWVKNFNFQAKLVQNEQVWKRCQYYWTNFFVPNLNRLVDNDYDTDTDGNDENFEEGAMLKEWLPRFRSSMAMNDARWGAVNYAEPNNNGDGWWGTKVTTNYVNRSFNFQVGNQNSGNAAKAYDNSVYYLNDWIVTRWQYMSNEGGLYDTTQLQIVEAKNASFTAVQDGDKLTITATADIIYNGENMTSQYRENITYDVYVNDIKVATNTLNNTTSITLQSGIESYVHVVVYFTKAPNTYATSEKQKFSYGISDYKVENVSFTAVQNDGAITITPSANVTKGGTEVAPNLKEYTVYVNGTAVATKIFAAGNATVSIPEGKVSKIYITVNPVGVSSISGTSATQEFAFNVKVDTVTAKVYFKSSTSLRYRPSLTVGTGDKTTMIKDDNGLLGKNASQTQSYYWYYLDVEIEKDKATKLIFTNSYSMNGVATVTLSESADALYFGVDNLNDGAVAVQLPADAENEHIRNFFKSATHMVHNEAHDGTLAKTRIAGVSYNMGDADGDGNVSVLDSTQMQRALVGKTELSETGTMLADFDLNSVNSIMDATLVQVYLTN